MNYEIRLPPGTPLWRRILRVLTLLAIAVSAFVLLGHVLDWLVF